MNIDELMSKHSDNYRFHGAGDFFSSLIEQAENDVISLWGRTHDDAVDGECECEWVQGEGYLYCTDIRGLDVCFDNFASDGIVLVLEKTVDVPQEWYPRSADRRERLIRVEEWQVVGGIHALYDEDGDMIDQEAFSVTELMEM